MIQIVCHYQLKISTATFVTKCKLTLFVCILETMRGLCLFVCILETMRGLCLSERIQDVIISAMQKFINSAILQEVALECLAALSAAGV